MLGVLCICSHTAATAGLKRRYGDAAVSLPRAKAWDFDMFRQRPAAATGPGSRLARLGMPVPLEDSATLPAEELASQVTRTLCWLLSSGRCSRCHQLGLPLHSSMLHKATMYFGYAVRRQHAAYLPTPFLTPVPSVQHVICRMHVLKGIQYGFAGQRGCAGAPAGAERTGRGGGAGQVAAAALQQGQIHIRPRRSSCKS